MTSNALKTLSPSLPLGSLDTYIANAQRVPMLSAEEEVELAENLQKNNDLEAARRLIMSHLRFVIKIARGYSGYGLAMADLIQEGNIGLMKAVKRFDPKVGVRLVSFAVHWIKAEIHEFIIRNWRIVKVATTKAQRKLFFNLRRNKRENTWFTNQEVKDVADTLGVTQNDVVNMEQRLAASDASYDGPSNDDQAELTYQAPAHYLADNQADPALQLEQYDTNVKHATQLRDAFTQLDERSQIIVRERWLTEEKATLHDLAARFDVSAERIRQLEKAALDKLRANCAE